MIELRLPKKTSFVSGNPYGRKIYREQVQKHIDKDKKIKVVFPEHVEFVSLSFIQGFISELSKDFGKDQVLTLVSLESPKPRLNNRLQKMVRF